MVSNWVRIGVAAAVGALVGATLVYHVTGPGRAGASITYVAGMPPALSNSPLYVVDVKKGVTPADIKIGIEAAAEGENMNLVGTLNVEEGLKARGIKTHKPYMIYEICNLLLGAPILKRTPEFGAFAPCKIILFQQHGRLKLLTYLPTYALRYFPPNAGSAKVARKLDILIIHIMKRAASGGF